MLGEVWQKVFVGLTMLGIGFTVPVLTYEQRIFLIEKELAQAEAIIFSETSAQLLKKELEIELERLRAQIRSNRIFIKRECFRNNAQERDANRDPLNHCDQDY